MAKREKKIVIKDNESAIKNYQKQRNELNDALYGTYNWIKQEFEKQSLGNLYKKILPQFQTAVRLAMEIATLDRMIMTLENQNINLRAELRNED